MTYFLLILALSGPDHPAREYLVAVMVDKSACTVAAAGMKQVLEDANPGLTVTPRCEAQAEGEPA